MNKDFLELKDVSYKVGLKNILSNITFSLKKGEILTDKNLTTKRPEDGISPLIWDQIVGRKANKNFEKDELITL